MNAATIFYSTFRVGARRTSCAVVTRLTLCALYAAMPFYAVAKGKKPGIYATWPECQAQVLDFKGARYKKFSTQHEAEEFIQENSLGIVDNRPKVASSGPVLDIRQFQENQQVKNQKAKSSRLQPSVINNNDDDGRLSPTVLQMKKDMKRLQKELSDLRTRFDDYISRKPGLPSQQTQGLHTSATLTAKRKRAAKSEDESDEDLPQPCTSRGAVNGDAKTKFAVDEQDFLIVYTDGACEGNGKPGSKAGVGVYFGKNHPFNVSEPVKGRATNNTAEIQAATYALQLTHAAGFSKVAIHTDSQFMISCMTQWLKAWKRNNWIKKDGGEVKNKGDLMDLDKASEGLMVKWVHVKGHAGILGNEEADRLARGGAKRYKVSWGRSRKDSDEIIDLDDF